MSDKWLAYTGHEPTYEKFSFRELIHPEDLPGVMNRWNECVKTGSAYEGEYRLRNIESDSFRWFRSTIAPLKDEHDKVIKWIGSATDIHEQKMVAIQLENKVAERTRELTALNEQLERSNSELEQYAYVASHDLKEPLRKIQIFSNKITMMHAPELTDAVAGLVSKINSASTKMGGLIDDLLKYSKLSNKLVLFDSVDLNDVVRDVCIEFEHVISQHQIVIEVATLPVVKAVPFQMHQLFVNLFSNSIKFSKPNVANKISITCSLLTNQDDVQQFPLNTSGSYYKIVFQDQGIGFSSVYSDQIFTIFQRLQYGSGVEGHGIGLALCRKIVHNHNGYIAARGDEGKGAEFTIILPQSSEESLQ
jgi:two-component system, chemotaxis family, CheB/CheR fusion protein